MGCESQCCLNEVRTAIFVGANGSMGLRTGYAYGVEIYENNGKIWVDWGTNKSPYDSMELVYENWFFPVKCGGCCGCN